MGIEFCNFLFHPGEAKILKKMNEIHSVTVTLPPRICIRSHMQEKCCHDI